MQGGGFTLVELLVVISVISLLIGIMIPVLGKARRAGRTIKKMNNQRIIIRMLNLFAEDNDGRYPESVATIGVSNFYWNWQDPRMMTSYRALSPGRHRAMSAYLDGYIEDASIMYCLNAPRKYRYLQQAWEAGDNWDHPQTPRTQDPLTGTYCFYWNYIGCLEGQRGRFFGPKGPAGGRRQSKLLVSDYFGYYHWRNEEAYGSCEKFKGAYITDAYHPAADFWTSEIGSDVPEIKLLAGYTDGHVESYSSREVVKMNVSINDDGSEPYPEGVGPGIFYLPVNGVR